MPTSKAKAKATEPSRAEPSRCRTPTPKDAPSKCGHRAGNADRATGGNPYTAPQADRATAEQGQQDGQPSGQDSHRAATVTSTAKNPQPPPEPLPQLLQDF